MTPKEKAKELVDKYKFYLGNENENIKEAVDLSLIAVDEIINNICKSSSFEIYYLNDDKMNEVEAINYWQEVKNEINKL